jgi:tetratricopeptide (TPR) repeat protein
VAKVAGYLKKLRASRLGTLDAEAPEAGEITISETLRLSEAQLPEAERAAWRNLGVFTASFDARAAQAIAGAEETMLDHFVRRSLLECEGADRYKLHDLAADYARAQLGEAPLTALHLAHARHYTAVGEEADQLYLQGQPVQGLALFDAERAQLEAAYAWLATRDDAAAAQPMIALVNAVVYTGQTLRFHPRQLIAWLESQLRAARLLQDRSAEGNALGNLGIAHATLGDARKAIEYYEQQLDITREIGDRRGEGNALGNLGNAHADLGDARKAVEYHEKALIIDREIGDRRGEGQDLGNLGLAHYSLGDARKAIEYHEQALIIDREIDDRRGEGQDLGNLGIAHAALGDARKAIEYYEQALVIAREIGDRRGEGTDLWNSALAYDSLGNRAEAIPRADAALAIREAIEDPNAAKVRAKLAQWRGQA